MKKTFVLFMLIFSILITSSVQTAFAQQQKVFTDLSPDHESYDTIMNLVAEGIVEGYEDGTVKPDKYITRAELMKIIVEGMGLNPHPLDYSRCFPDVNIVDEWYIGYVCFAKSEGWIIGYPDGTFKPESNINNIEILSMIFRSYGFDIDDYRRLAVLFDDVEEYSWYYSYLLFAVENEIVDGDAEKYYPGELITRAQAFEILNKTLAYIDGLTKPAEFTVDNLTFTHPGKYQKEDAQELSEGFHVFVNEDDDGIGFVDESVFDDFVEEFGLGWEELFEYMEGKNATITIKKGKVVKVTDYNEYTDDYSGMFFFKVEPTTGTGDSFYVVGHYLTDETRAEILEMFKTIEIK